MFSLILIFKRILNSCRAAFKTALVRNCFFPFFFPFSFLLNLMFIPKHKLANICSKWTEKNLLFRFHIPRWFVKDYKSLWKYLWKENSRRVSLWKTDAPGTACDQKCQIIFQKNVLLIYLWFISTHFLNIIMLFHNLQDSRNF